MTKNIQRRKNNDVEEKLRAAFESVTPDIFPSILESLNCEKGMAEKKDNISDYEVLGSNIAGENSLLVNEENVDIRKSKFNFGSAWLKRFAAVAAAVCLIIAAGFGANRYNLANAIESIITVDVNPSIEISVNAAEKVLGVKPLNDDAERIVGDMDFRGSSLEVTLNALIGSMLRTGYISDSKNSILLSVDNGDSVRREELKNRLTNEINNILSRESVSGAIISTDIGKDPEIVRLAEEYGITQGKVKLIKDIADKSDRYDFSDLVSLSINELNLIAESPRITLTTVSKTGSASDSGYIGKKAALNAALKNAGLSLNQVNGVDTEIDYVKGRMVYEVEFKSAGFEYEYDIDANTGAVVKTKRERDDDFTGDVQNGIYPSIYGDKDDEYDDDEDDYDDDYDDDETVRAPETSIGADKSGGNVQAAEYIGKERAKEIAFAGAGVRAKDVIEIETEREKEKGAVIYEISFKVGNVEYECKVDAVTGSLIRINKEVDEEDDRDDIYDEISGDYDDDED